MTPKQTGQELARRGYAVHRIGGPTGKAPVDAEGLGLAGWTTRPAPTPQRIAVELRDAERLGVRAGGGLLVLDVDVKDGDGFAALEAYAESIGWDLPAYTVRTGGGGAHLWLRLPEGERARNGVGKDEASPFGAGVDWRGDGGQVVTAPSSHDSGKAYEWVDGLPPAISELPAAPAEVVEAVRAKERIAHRARPVSTSAAGFGVGAARSRIERAVADIASASEGERNHVLNAAAYGTLGFVKAGRAEYEAVMGAYAEAALSAGLDMSEIEPTLASAYAAAPVKESRDWRKPVEHGLKDRAAVPIVKEGDHAAQDSAVRGGRAAPQDRSEVGAAGAALHDGQGPESEAEARFGEGRAPQSERRSAMRCPLCKSELGEWASSAFDRFGRTAGVLTCGECSGLISMSLMCQAHAVDDEAAAAVRAQQPEAARLGDLVLADARKRVPDDADPPASSLSGAVGFGQCGCGRETRLLLDRRPWCGECPPSRPGAATAPSGVPARPITPEVGAKAQGAPLTPEARAILERMGRL